MKARSKEHKQLLSLKIRSFSLFPSFGFLYILVAVDYVSKWIEAIPSRNNDKVFERKYFESI
jgi:hypothetical protein